MLVKCNLRKIWTLSKIIKFYIHRYVCESLENIAHSFVYIIIDLVLISFFCRFYNVCFAPMLTLSVSRLFSILGF